MCFVVNKFLHLFQVLRNFQNTATAINAPPSPLLVIRIKHVKNGSFWLNLVMSSLLHNDLVILTNCCEYY